MTRTELLLVLLMEECDETSQRASKAIRFGLDEVQEGQELNNAQRLVYEFNDVLAVMQVMIDEGLIDNEHDKCKQAINAKKGKIKQWLAYSAKCGTMINE